MNKLLEAGLYVTPLVNLGYHIKKHGIDAVGDITKFGITTCLSTYSAVAIALIDNKFSLLEKTINFADKIF